MYGSYGSYNSPPPDLSNNPFIDHASNASARYPDVGGFTSPTDSQFTSWVGQPNGVPQQQGYNTYNPQPAQQQYTAGWGGSPTYQAQGSGFVHPQQQTAAGTRFQPSSSFGQQLSSAIDGGAFLQGGPGYQQQPQQPQQPQQQFTSGYGMPNGYNTTGGVPGQIQIPATPYQQTGVTSPGYLSEFDPYATIGQGTWDNRQQPQQPQQQQSGRGSTNGGAPNSQNDLHPLECVRKHKQDLDSWDAYSWKQLINSLESLKIAWERRKQDLDMRVRQLSANWGAASPQELAQYKSVRFLALLLLRPRVTAHPCARCSRMRNQISVSRSYHPFLHPTLSPLSSVHPSVFLSIERSTGWVSPVDRPSK